MGLRLGFSRSSYDPPSNIPRYLDNAPLCSQLPNPNPKKFEILRWEKIGRFLIVKINYPDCNNYEGNKILVFENIEITDLIKQGSIDPHFSENRKFHSPIVRFVPNMKGWKMARKLAQSLVLLFAIFNASRSVAQECISYLDRDLTARYEQAEAMRQEASQKAQEAPRIS